MKASKINFRVLLFVLVMFALPGTLIYIYVDSVVTGGIKDRGDYLEVDLKAMSDFPFDQVNGTLEDVPQKWRDLDGKRILVQGEIWAPNAASYKLDEFQVVYSISKCCNTSSPQIQHFVDAKPTSGTVFNYGGVVKILGTLHVEVQHTNGRVSRVYRMEVEQVEPV